MAKRSQSWLLGAGAIAGVVAGLAIFLAVLEDRSRGTEHSEAVVDRMDAEPILAEAPSTDPVPDRLPAEQDESRSPQAAAADPVAIYALQDPEGRMVAEAWVALWKPGALLASGRTSAAGEFWFEPAEEAAGKLLVLDTRVAPQILDVPLTAGRHVVVLPPGRAVQGHVVRAGGKPVTDLPLSLISFRELLELDPGAGVDWAALELPLGASRWLRARTDAEGQFRFEGLPADWRGELRLPVEYRLEDQTLAAGAHALNVLPLDAPTEDLWVRVERRVTLVGRVVEVAGRQPIPVPGAVVLPLLEFPASAGRTYVGECVADEEGRFRSALPSPSILGGKIQIAPRGREHFRQIEVQAVEVEGELDLGDLALADRAGTRMLVLEVLDDASQPIEGAVADINATSPSSAPTDALGRTELYHAIPGVTTFAVYARGYEVAEVAVPLEPPEVLEVVLRRAALLDLRFLQPDGEVARMVAVRLASSRSPYRNEAPPRNYKGYTATGCSFYLTHTQQDGTRVVRLNALAEGRVVLNDLEPGIPLDLRVEGRFGGIILEEQIAPLQPGEHRVREITLQVAPRKISGRVLDDETGKPLPQAHVSVTYGVPDVSVAQARTLSATVRADGSFEVPGLYEPTVYLSAGADGYVEFLRSSCEVPEEGLFLEIRLGRGNAITVTVEDEQGKRLPVTLLADRLAEPEWGGMGRKVEGKEGVYLIRDVPDGEIEITAYIHGLAYTRHRHDSRIAELTFIVPVGGNLEVALHLFDEAAVDRHWLLCLIPTSDSELPSRYAPTSRPQFPNVLTGSYFVVLRRFPRGFAHMDEFLEMSPRVPIDIQGGRDLSIDLWQRP